MKDRFVSYNSPTDEVHGISEEAVQERKRVRNVERF